MAIDHSRFASTDVEDPQAATRADAARSPATDKGLVCPGMSSSPSASRLPQRASGWRGAQADVHAKGRASGGERPKQRRLTPSSHG